MGETPIAAGSSSFDLVDVGRLLEILQPGPGQAVVEFQVLDGPPGPPKKVRRAP